MFFRKKKKNKLNVGSATVYLILLDGTRVEGLTYRGLNDDWIGYMGVEAARSGVERQSANGLFKLPNGSYITREQVKAVEIEVEDYLD